MQFLLDKVTARYTMRGMLKLSEDIAAPQNELAALAFFIGRSVSKDRLFIAQQTANILRQIIVQPRYDSVINLFNQRIEIAKPDRYFKRWRRRLQDFGFTREDASILALASFGTDSKGRLLSTEYVITFDQHMIKNWQIQKSAIHPRFHAMRSKLPPLGGAPFYPKLNIPKK